MITSFKELMHEMLEVEGLKKQVDIAQMREVFSKFAIVLNREADLHPGDEWDWDFYSCIMLDVLYRLGKKKRAKKCKRKRA